MPKTYLCIGGTPLFFRTCPVGGATLRGLLPKAIMKIYLFIGLYR